MDKFKKFALRRPLLFGLLLIVLYSLLAALTYPVHFLFPETEAGTLYGDTLAEVIIFLFFLGVLWWFRWEKASGITRPGRGRLWLVVAAIVVYKVLVELFAFTGNFSIALPNSELDFAKILYYLPGSLVEETIARALVLVAMVMAWGETKRGQVKAVILSALVFGLLHLFNLFNRPAGEVLFQTVVVTLPGILYAALVLHGRTLWPAIIIHWLTNAAVNVKITGIENFEETFSMWLIFGVALIPLMAYSAYLIWKLPDAYHYDIEDTAVSPTPKPGFVQ